MASPPPAKRRKENSREDKDSPVVVFSHGAGAPSTSEWMLRVSCMVSVREGIEVHAVVCLGYPLKGMNGAVQDETLLKLNVPTLFVQGSKDSLCSLGKLEATRKKMKSRNELHVIDGGDHSFKIGKKFLQSSGSNQDEAEREAVKAIGSFVCEVIQGSESF